MSVNISLFSFFCSDCLDPFLSRRFRLTLQYKVDGFYCKFSNWLWIKFILDLWLKAHSINIAAIQLKLRSFYGLKLFKFDKLLFFNFSAYPAYLYKTNLRYVISLILYVNLMVLCVWKFKSYYKFKALML